MDLKELEKSLEKVFETHDITKHDISYISGKPPVLQIMIATSDGNADLETCINVSHDISDVLDQLDFGDTAYNLDVCSFGAERELQPEELDSSVGENVYIKFINPKEGLDEVEGIITECNEDSLNVEYNVKGRKKTAIVARDNI